jgi:hypothetical protein
VLLVKAEAGQVREVLGDRPLWLRDKFSNIADTSVTYMLIETAGSNILRSGTANPPSTRSSSRLSEATTTFHLRKAVSLADVWRAGQPLLKPARTGGG